MPPPAGRLRVRGYFLALFVILVALYSIVFFSSQSNAPKLGLDLEGGAQIVFKATTTNGKPPSSTSMKVARQILTTRVNGAGVSSATVIQQGSDTIVVSVPGKSVSDIADIGAAAQLNFRPVIAAPLPANATPTPSASATGSPPPTASGSSSSTQPETTGTGTTTGSATAKSSSSSAPSAANIAAAPTSAASSPTGSGTPTGSVSPTASASGAATSPSPSASPSTIKINQQDPLSGLGFTAPTSDTAFSALSQTQQATIYERLDAFTCKSESSQKPKDEANQDLFACDSAKQYKYILGPVIVPGSQISTASAVAPNPGQQGGSSVWTVALDLKSAGQSAWAKYTSAHHDDTTDNGVQTCTPNTSAITGQADDGTGRPCAEYVGFTLDGEVINAPHNQATINGTTSISGSFTEDTATELANQLKFGALPISFNTQTQQTVSATLGTGQLKAGILAGGIGLILVVIYSLLYYRGLGFVTIASLLVSGGLTYASLVILGREIGFTLTLAGIAGFIVAVGITADSFVVFFERIKDEVHDGRSFATAVPRAWVRARRTIISADVVSLLAAAILYYLAAGDVRGFAFTLGLSTILDLVVVFLFTHPLVSLLSRNRAFGSPRFTGLNAVRHGGAVPAEPGVAPRPARPSRGGGTAVLEREKTDLDTADDVEVETAEETAVPVEPDPVDDHKVSAATASARRRARAERDAVVDTGMSAAERAAARRGRQARPEAEPEPAVDEIEPVEEETEVEPVEDEPAAPRRGRSSRRRRREPEPMLEDADETPGISEIPEPALTPADVVEPVDETVTSTVEKPVVDTSPDVVDTSTDEVDTSTAELSPAARRAAERRARLAARKNDGKADS